MQSAKNSFRPLLFNADHSILITYAAMTRRGRSTSSYTPLIISSQHSLQNSLSAIRRCSKDRRSWSILRWHKIHVVVLDLILHTPKQPTQEGQFRSGWGRRRAEQIFNLAPSCFAKSLGPLGKRPRCTLQCTADDLIKYQTRATLIHIGKSIASQQRW